MAELLGGVRFLHSVAFIKVSWVHRSSGPVANLHLDHKSKFKSQLLMFVDHSKLVIES